MKELTRDQKVAIVERALRDHDGTPLCIRLAGVATNMGFITFREWVNNSFPKVTQTLVPEILLFKPERVSGSQSWFGNPLLPESIEKRRQVLEELLDMLKNQEQPLKNKNHENIQGKSNL
jgi:hypothetical protein